MSAEDQHRHPGGRTCASAMLALVVSLAAVSGLALGALMAVLH